MKICLATIHDKPAFIPLALLYLKAYLVERRNYALAEVDILEFRKDSTEGEILDQILSTEADVVGLSCYVWNIKRLTAVSRELKNIRPQIKLVLGGPEVGPLAPAVLKAHPHIDVIVKSEGEIPF